MPLILLVPTFNLFFNWPASPAFPNRPTYRLGSYVLPVVVVCGAYPTLVYCSVQGQEHDQRKIETKHK